MTLVRRLVAAVCLVLLLSGCWDRLEVNDLGIITLVGMDKTEDGVRVTINVAVPARAGGGGGGGGPGSNPGTGGLALTYTATGPSVAAAVKDLQSRASRRLFWGHARALVIGGDLARSGVSDVLDFWSRHREPRLLMDVVVTPGKAAEFLTAQPRLERLLAEAVRESITMNEHHHINLNDFLRSMRSPDSNAVAPRALLVPGTPSGQDVQISGAAVFRSDRLAGFLDNAETRGLMWLRDDIQPGLITTEVPDAGHIGIEVYRGQTVVRTEFPRGKLRLAVQVRAEGDLVESQAPLSLSKVQSLEPLERAASRQILNQMQEVLRRLQSELRADAALLGEAVRQDAPLAWERTYKRRWADLFPEVPVDISVELQIRRTGEHGSPLTKKKQG